LIELNTTTFFNLQGVLIEIPKTGDSIKFVSFYWFADVKRFVFDIIYSLFVFKGTLPAA